MNAPFSDTSITTTPCFDPDARFINPLHDRPPSPEQRIKEAGKGYPTRTLATHERTAY